MPQTVDRSTLLGYFERRKKPTQPQYADLINTAVLFEADPSSSQDSILMNYINEKTPGQGVTIESVILNDSGVTAAGGFTGNLIGNVTGDVTGNIISTTVTSTTVTTTSLTADAINSSNSTLGAAEADSIDIDTSSGVYGSEVNIDTDRMKYTNAESPGVSFFTEYSAKGIVSTRGGMVAPEKISNGVGLMAFQVDGTSWTYNSPEDEYYIFLDLGMNITDKFTSVASFSRKRSNMIKDIQGNESINGQVEIGITSIKLIVDDAPVSSDVYYVVIHHG
jgi:hypothetical protein